MAIQIERTLDNCDGFEVLTPRGFVGWVEETWVDRHDNPTAFALRISDGRRGLLIADAVLDCVRERRSLLVSSDVRVLELEPPHIDAGGALFATWRPTGEAIDLPEPPGPVRHAVVDRLHRPVVPNDATRHGDRPLWEVLAILYSCLGVLAITLIGLDFLIAYFSTGRAY
jgi:hypothetical protein